MFAYKNKRRDSIRRKRSDMEYKEHRTTARVIDILELAAHSADGLTFSEISAQLSMPKGSLHPILQTLCGRGYLQFSERSRRYRIGAAMFAAGNRYVENADIHTRIQRELHKLSRTTYGTSYLGILTGGEALYLLKETAPAPFEMRSRPGYRIPAYCSAMGKALLSQHTDEELRALYDEPLPTLTPKSISTLAQLRRQLDEVRRTGFAEEYEEASLHVRCVGVPVFLDGRIAAAISCSFPILEGYSENEPVLHTALTRAREAVEAILAADREHWIYK